jgi:NADPH:quinone reductase-like Zn-dependent oxidoreductase
MSTSPMLAITYDHYGPPSSLRLTKVHRPAITGDEEVLVRVVASSVNPSDWHRLTGTPYIARLESGLRRPKRIIPGTDLAGRVEAVGAAVTGLRIGDEVFGWTPGGAFAEYVAVPAANLAPKPPAISLEQAGTVGVAAFTALQALRDRGSVGQDTRVLINGASGGVGTFAVQIAAAMGARTTAVCSTRNVEQAAALGASRVVDYRTADLADRPADGYDVIIDIAGNIAFGTIRRLLVDTGTYVLVGGPKTNRLLGPLAYLVKVMLRFGFSRQRAIPMLATENPADLAVARRRSLSFHRPGGR